MEDSEITLSGIGISKSVIAQIVSTAVEKVEGVARVGGNDIASGLVSVLLVNPCNPAVQLNVKQMKMA